MQGRPLTGKFPLEQQTNQKRRASQRKQKQPSQRTTSGHRQSNQLEVSNQQQRGASIQEIGSNLKQSLASSQRAQQRNINDTLSNMSSQDQVPQNIVSAQSRFRIAMPNKLVGDVSGKYWNQISNKIDNETQNLKDKLASQRLQPATGSQKNLKTPNQGSQRNHTLQIEQHQFHPQLLSQGSERNQNQRQNIQTPVIANIPKNDLEQFSKPFQFLSNLGGKQTNSASFTTKIDRNLLKHQKTTVQNTISGQIEGSDFATFSKGPKEEPSELIPKFDNTGEKFVKTNFIQENQQNPTQITIYTDMNVDRHDFQIKERRIVQRAVSATTQRQGSTYRSQKSQPQTVQAQYQQTAVNVNKGMSRPISGMIPPTQSQKILTQQQPQIHIQGFKGVQKNTSQKDFKISKQRPFSANPKFQQMSGLNRPFSAQMQMADLNKFKQNKENLVSEVDSDDEDIDEDEEQNQYLELQNQAENYQMDTESFSQRIMSSRPTTAYKKSKNYELPYPELFDRSERTYAATFAKYGDLSYYTPIQRIGAYMDFSARLKKRHLMDLIAYMKTSKATIKPSEEEQNEAELAELDYKENCLFLGVMPEEELEKPPDKELVKIEDEEDLEYRRNLNFDPTVFKYEGSFQYQNVWSDVLMNQVQLSVHRFNHYIESQDAIKNEEISKYKKDWMSHALDLVPEKLLSQFNIQVRKIFTEIFANYARAMKISILEYILRSPDERKRLHILMLPRPVPTASMRQLLAGGYSTHQYLGCHERKIEAENEIKLRLLGNNVVISSLQSWWADFRSINLVEFRNISQFVQDQENNPQQLQYSIDVDGFWNFQETYRQKTFQFMKYIWHRGCMLIIKKFKFLRLREQYAQLEHGKSSKGKWTFSGYNPQPEYNSARELVDDLKWEDIETFRYKTKQTKLQQYFMRTASVHTNVNLNYFLMGEGYETDSIPDDYFAEKELEDLVDIRENSAYIAFVSMIGGYINFEENGYDILAKEYKRELKYAAGNLMKTQLKSMIDKGVETMVNYFKGFVTLDKMKKYLGNKPLRIIRPLVTVERVKVTQVDEKLAKKQKEEQSRVQHNSKLHEQLKKREIEKKKKQLGRMDTKDDQKKNLDSEFDSVPQLNYPDFMDYQDFVNPIMRLDLTLVFTGSQLGINQGIQNGDQLQFTKKEADIIDDFEIFFTKMINSFNDFARPEFSKIRIVSKKRYEDDLEDEMRQKKMSIQIKKSTGQFKQGQTSFVSNQNNQNGTNSSNFYGNKIVRDFESLLFRNHEDGQDVYRKQQIFKIIFLEFRYLGRVQLKESEKQTKDLIDENNLGIFSRPFVDKRFKVADIEEDYYQDSKKKISKIFAKHIKEAKRVVELFNQFESIIKGTMQQRVKEFIKEDRRERETEIIIKELRYYDKLSRQLPHQVFFPMFEVGVFNVKEEIQRRINLYLQTILKKFEQTLLIRSQGICDKYVQICKFLEKSLKTPQDVLEMERYKNNLLLELGNLNEKIFENRKSIFFLMNHDKMFEEDTWNLIKEIHLWPNKLSQHTDACDDKHRAERIEIENYVVKRKDQFDFTVTKLEEVIYEVGTWGDLYGYRIVIDKVVEYQQQIEALDELMGEISQEEMMLFGFKTNYDQFVRIKKYFTPFNELWMNISDIMLKKIQWMECPLSQIDPDEVDSMIKTSIKTLQRLQKQLSENQLAQKVLHSMGVEISDLNEWLPTIEVLCNPSLKKRHWDEIQKVSEAQFNHRETSLNLIKNFNIKDKLDQLSEISEKAKKENRLEKMLDKMENEWKELRFELSQFRDTGIPILSGSNVEEIQLLLDEHTLTAQTIRLNPDVLPMEERAVNWEQMMIFLQEVIEVWVKVQSNYLYLEPIFHSEDITNKLPQEAMEFQKIDKSWRDIMIKVQQDTLVLHLKKIKKVQDSLNNAHQILERIQKSLNDYLETKRQYFPRFYFLSNEDLLEILGDSKNPEKVQRHLKKCFEGINEVVFRSQKPIDSDRDSISGIPEEKDDEIIAILSRESERINLVKSIFPHDFRGNVEQWLLELENQMKLSLQQVITNSINDYPRHRERSNWIKNWQGQVVLTVSQVKWTQTIEKILQQNGSQKGLKDYFKKSQAQLDEIVNMVRQQLTNLMRLTLGSLIVIDVHAKDVLESLIQEDIQKVDDFQWLSQMRYYYQVQEKHVQIKMITTVQNYGYEYLGNTGRLVITPLTDRVYRTLMSALHLNLGGAPEGPAGTGKTESTKDLAKAIAVHCMVFNCAEGLNAKAMAKFFKGLASAGSWSCFDEFNRIELEVLSVVAQQILEIQRAKTQQKEMFRFEEADIVLRDSCNIFITMNPGYAGRSELPDNLKALFRPVAMMIPDYTMIAEISLYSFGFLESRNLAKKIVATYRLCSEQLSSQYHYDYGMRAVKSVLTAAKGLKQKFSEEREDILILRSLNDVNIPKFLAHDIPLFQGIIDDLFQGIALPDINYGSLNTCMKQVIKDMNLQEIKPFMYNYFSFILQCRDKVYQLYEMINVRHGLMLVGPQFGAKTSCYQVLQKSLDLLAKDDPKYGELPVDTYILNPKSITLNQLYGSFDQISHDFTDGIIGQIFRKCAYIDVGRSRRWIIFDGPVDAEWIENMNTVLDDNKKLCLMNGEIIQMSDQMTLMFETYDLSQASPATVSRCGMVYLQPENNVGWQALVTSWIETLKEKSKGTDGETLDPLIIKRIEDLFEIFFIQATTFVRKKCKAFISTAFSEVHMVQSHLRLFFSFLTNAQFLEFAYNPRSKIDDIINRIDMSFLYCLSWSVGAVCDEQGQKNFGAFIRKNTSDIYKLKGNKTLKIDKNSLIPEGAGSNIQNYFIDDQRWVNWKDVLDKQDHGQQYDPSLTYHELIVSTTENLKNSYFLNLCIKNNISPLFVGPTGTGKTVSIQKYLRSLPSELYQSIFICFSAKTSANQTQDIIDGKLEKRGRRKIGPPLGKKCIIFIDDLNMPALEKYGAQPPIELLRQWMDHGGWYDYKEKDKAFKRVIELIFVTAMGPPGGGKNQVTPRYTRHFNIASIGNFEEQVLQRIFSKLMDWHIKRNNFGSQDAARLLSQIVAGSVDVFLFAQQELKPTPAKSHYLFNLRDLSRVIQGVQLARKEELTDGKKVLRLWVHEIARVFSDRLINDEDQMLLYSRLFTTARDKIRDDLFAAIKYTFDERKYLINGNKDIMIKHILFADVLGDGISTQDRNYDEIHPEKRQILNDRISGYLEDFNSVSKKPMNLVLFDFAVMHVLRICRVLKMARGNAFLIGLGGSGRQSLSKLATFICDYDIVETEQNKNYNIDQWKDDMKRVLIIAGQEVKNSMFLLSDSQMKYGFMLEDINNLLNSGEIPNLFPHDEKLQIIEKLRPVAKKDGRIDLYNNGTNEQFQDFFVEKIKQHLHIILSMSPIGNSLRERIRNFPSLVNCCTINWFTRWPEEALEAVADKFLQEDEVEKDEKIAIIKMCKKIHTDIISLSSKFLKEQKRYNYVTPTSYLELIQTYKTLLKKVRSKTLSLKQGYDKGIEKLLFTAEEVTKMQQDLAEKQPKLEQMTIETDQLMEKIQKESKEVVEPKKILIQEEESRANQMAQEAQTIKIECDNDLSKALPLVKKAQDALNTIQSSHINEVKFLGKPPEPIKKVLHAVCVMCQRKVEKTPKKEAPREFEENWWFTAQKFMSEKNFLESLLEFDKDHIPETVMNKIRTQFLGDPDFKPQRVEKASFAAKGLCMWIRALDQYDNVAKLIAPKRLRAKEAEQKYKMTLEGLKEKQYELKLIVDQFQLLQAELEKTALQKQKLQEDIEDCSRKIERAQTLLTGLGGEQKRWEDQTLLLQKLYKNLVGDILLSSAIISYQGAFTSVYRNEVLKQWLYELNNLNLNSSTQYSLQQVLGEPVNIRHWNLNGLPSDSYSIDNGIIVFNSRRWPLMIDPQGQANRWIKNLEQQSTSRSQNQTRLHIIKQTDPDLVRVFEQCLQLGYPILLENIGEELDPILEPVLLKQTFKSAGVISINFGDNIIEYSSDFRLYITSKYANPHYLPELSTKVTIINFMITFEGLKDQLLNLVVQKENASLDEERHKLIVQSYENKKQLKDIENKILDVLRTSQGNILDDEKAIDILKQSQELSKEIQEKQEIAEITEGKLEEARKLYNPIAYHSSLLFFIIQKLSFVDVMYQYSLTWFISLFLLSIENSEKSEFIDQRLEALKSYFTYSLYSNICRSLFEKHKLLFSFILTAKINEAEGKISSSQYDFLISTQAGLENPLQAENPADDWLSTYVWNRFCELSRIEKRFNSLVNNFKIDINRWKAIFKSDFPYQENFPLSTDNQSFTMFQKICIIKVLRPDKIIQAIKEYVVLEKGEIYVNPPPFDIENSFNDSNYFTPLIFVLPGSNPLNSLTAFSHTKKKFDTLKSISLGQDQGPKAEKAIEEAKKFGGWVLLQNCHLYPSWMVKLERICENLEMKVSGKESVHPSFRLWLTSYPSNDFPILILQNGIKMTNEPPKGLKANMIGSYKLASISDQNFFNVHPKPEAFKKLTYGLCMFHAIIQERRNYGSLGWNIRYEFTVSDLEISVKQLHLFVGQYADVPFKALKYLTGECNYGGRVTDDRDRRVLTSLLQDFYTKDILKNDFKAFGLDEFSVPIGNLDYQKYLDHIQIMPLEEPPELFGFHPNANITKDLKETEEICYDLLKMGEIEGVKIQLDQSDKKAQSKRKNTVNEDKQGGDINKSELLIEKMCKDILGKLPKPFDIDQVQIKYPVLRENSMNTVLVQELTRFNQLLRIILSSLKNILLALKGEVLLSEQLEGVYNSLLIGEIPQLWLKSSYPSLKPVASYVKDFIIRLGTFQNWVTNGAPNVFWISGFFFTQSFLTGILQNYARRYKVEIDTLVFDFDFLDEDPTDYENEIYQNSNTKHKAPEDGSLISGIYLEGARWNYDKQHLDESQPKVLFSKVPIIWLRPIRQTKSTHHKIYECPLYKTQERKGILLTTGHSTNFILNVKVPIGIEDEFHWIKRGVAMLCQLQN